MPVLTDVSVYNQNARALVQTADTADYQVTPDDVGIIVNVPVVNHNGGPQQGGGPMSYIYRIVGTDEQGAPQQFDNMRYSNNTPNGNYQYTTQ